MASSISVAGDTVTFTCEAGDEAVAYQEVTTDDDDLQTSFSFEVQRRGLCVRIGTTTDGSEILPDIYYEPGFHILSITPGAGLYYVQFRLKEVGVAKLVGFDEVEPGDLELETPWSEADLHSLRWEQSLNTQWWFLGSTETRVFERRGENSWSLRKFCPQSGPFAALNLTNTTLTASARTGTGTVTASGPTFVAEDAGSLLRLTHAGQYETETFTAVDDVTDAIRVAGIEGSRLFFYSISGSFTGSIVLERSVGNELNYVTVTTLGAATSASLNDEFDNQVIYYRLRCTALSSGSPTVTLTYSSGVTDGIGRIVSVDADNEVTVDVLEPFAKLTPTTLWNRGAWSGRSGFPSCGALFDGRLYMSRGSAYWGSAPDDFEDFEVTPLADGALARSFPGQMSIARWMLAGEELMVGLSGQEQVIGSGALDEVIVPANVRARLKSNKGSADASAVLIDEAAVMISRSLERIYRFSPSEAPENRLIDLTRLNQNIGGSGGFKAIAYQVNPEPRIWGVRNDGQVAVHVFNPTERVFAWCRVVFDGTVEDVCILPGAPEDDVYFVVSRTIDGANKRFVEKLAPEAWGTLSEAWRLHCALEYSGAATDTIVGLGHLEGEAVYVWGNGRQSGPYTVSDSTITLDYEVTYAIVGLKYDGKYKSPRLNWAGNYGTAIGGNTQVERLGMILSRTPGGMLKYGRDFENMTTLKDRDTSFDYDSPLELRNEDIDVPFNGRTAKDPRICLLMDGAGPATVMGFVPKIHGKD